MPPAAAGLVKSGEPLIKVSNELPYVLDRLLPLLAAAIDGNPATR